MFLLAALCAAFWLLYETLDEIAELTEASVEPKPQTKSKFNWRSTAHLNLAACTGAALIFELRSSGPGTGSWIPALLSGAQICIAFLYRQNGFAQQDRQRIIRMTDTYIYTASPLTRSGWANNPVLLDTIPRWINSRHLTCMTLIEISLLLCTVNLVPSVGGLAIALCIGSHYVTDALDGALGRHRGEGYVQWGYYADHCFDAAYELACAVALVPLQEDQRLNSAAIMLMASTVCLFHGRELATFRAGTTRAYSNLIGGYPLHYLEFAAMGLALAAQAQLVTWHSVAIGLVLILTSATAGLWLLRGPDKAKAKHPI